MRGIRVRYLFFPVCSLSRLLAAAAAAALAVVGVGALAERKAKSKAESFPDQ